ncbi:MAG: IS66 family transposase [Gammaproteobacteria bacterium]|nr:IS66 family transposase [Gammaproteobacteria bacterium]
MKTNTNDLPDDIEALKEIIRSHQSRESHLQNQIDQLLEQIRLARHQRFGSQSEKSSPDQLGLFNEAETDQAEVETLDNTTTGTTVQSHQRKKSGRKPLPVELPRIEVIHDLEDSEKTCPHDGHTLKPIGETCSEQLDIIPAKIQVIRHIRKKYACPCCDQTIKTAKLPNQPISKSQASPGLLAHIAVSKYADALPLYRQAAMWKRVQVEFDRGTLANWMCKIGELIQPLINLLQDKLNQGALIHCDETTVQVLNEPGKKPQSQSYMWVRTSGQSGEKIILYDYHPSRSSEVPKQLFEDFKGILVTDGYAGYDAVAQQNGLIHAGCMVHARRKFTEAIKAQTNNKTGKAHQGLAFINKLYAIETEHKDATSEQKLKIRQEHAKPIIDQFKTWLEKSVPHVPPKTQTGKAIHYTLKQWSKLIVFLDHGIVPLDNNRAENAIRPFVIGRKNWIFSTSQRGAKASANIYSLIQTAKANEIEPFEYLKKVFTDLPMADSLSDIEKLLPISKDVD